MLLIGFSRVGPSHDKDSTPEHRYRPTRYLEERGSVLESQLAQSKAVEQFYLPRDENILGEAPNIGFHVSLQGSILRFPKAMVAVGDVSRPVQASYLKLLEELEAQKADPEKPLIALLTKEDKLVVWH
ncbi:uncharacterized protein A4U43_C03F24330 [Asparagus officinalis]|uniref:Uncharacterized protein n=1 Tax=Asparagus officinalis TaxID=4686 RepID=A0A5P1FFF9_ASPOF|nr:uncharacterized protein A4U43_C03F24330 [Asparagus officinalis]